MKMRGWLWCLILTLPVATVTWVAYPPPAVPLYCWLAFGSEADERVLARVAGATFSLDRDHDGAFRGKCEVFASPYDVKGVSAAGGDGKTSYVIQRVSTIGAGEQTRLMVEVDIRGSVVYQEYCDVGVAPDPSAAPVARFHAPLTVALQRLLDVPSPEQALRRGTTPTELRVNVSTIDQASGCWVVVRSAERYRPGVATFPAGVHPFVDVEYPPNRPGGLPVRRRYPLDKTCCGSIFHGPVPVPEEAGAGKARLTLSFDAWPAGHVSPSTAEVSIGKQ